VVSYFCATVSNELLGNCLSFDSLASLAGGGRVFKVSRIWVEILEGWRGDCEALHAEGGSCSNIISCVNFLYLDILHLEEERGDQKIME